VALLSCWVLPLLAESELLLAVSDRLVTTEQLQRGFTQEKSLPFLNRPLLSAGEFSISRDKGLLWRVTEPIASEMTVNSSGVHLDGRSIECKFDARFYDRRPVGSKKHIHRYR